MSAGLFDLAAANAGRTDFHSFGCPIVIDSDRLDIGLENTRRNFHHVHTDTAFFLCKTSTDDSGTVELFLSTDFTNVTHYDTSYTLRIKNLPVQHIVSDDVYVNQET